MKSEAQWVQKEKITKQREKAVFPVPDEGESEIQVVKDATNIQHGVQKDCMKEEAIAKQREKLKRMKIMRKWRSHSDMDFAFSVLTAFFNFFRCDDRAVAKGEKLVSAFVAAFVMILIDTRRMSISRALAVSGNGVHFISWD